AVLALSPDGKRIALATPDNGVKILDTSSGRSLGAIPGGKEEIIALALSAEPAKVVVVREGYTKELWSVDEVALWATYTPAGTISAVGFSNDGKLFAIGMADGNVGVYAGRNRIAAFSPERGEQSAGVKAIAFSPDGKLVAWGRENGVARIATASSDSR